MYKVIGKYGRVSGMETILFSSDLHGNLAALESLIEKAAKAGASSLLLAGDTCPTEGGVFAETLQTAGIDIFMVRGNCDSQWAFSASGIAFPPAIRKMPYGKRTIVLFHGDLQFPRQILDPGKRDILISGHTHRPALSADPNGTIRANPGSPTYPRGREGATYGIIDGDTIGIRYFSSDRPVPGLQYSLIPRNPQ